MPSRFCVLILLLSVSAAKPVLRMDYYDQTCPAFNKIVQETVITKQLQQPITAAGTLRLFFHDCFTEGCDASVLIATSPLNTTERDDYLNESLSGDAFEVVTPAKTALELTCPGFVSCADIKMVKMVGGPYYNVALGRKDGNVSSARFVGRNLPTPNMTVDRLLKVFEQKGFTLRDMVALSGAHTIGFAHCKEFSDRLLAYNQTTRTDPELNPKYVVALKVLCRNHLTDLTESAFNDVITPGIFDNMYFKNLRRGLGLLASDHILVKDSRTRPFVNLYARNQTTFFENFANAMEKLRTVGVKGDGEGEIRRRCDQFNTCQP